MWLKIKKELGLRSLLWQEANLAQLPIPGFVRIARASGFCFFSFRIEPSEPRSGGETGGGGLPARVARCFFLFPNENPVLVEFLEGKPQTEIRFGYNHQNDTLLAVWQAPGLVLGSTANSAMSTGSKLCFGGGFQEAHTVTLSA